MLRCKFGDAEERAASHSAPRPQLRICSAAKSIVPCRMHLQKKLHGGLRCEKRGWHLKSQTGRIGNPGHQKDAHGFDGFIGSLSSVFNPGTGIQINVAGFNVDIWRCHFRMTFCGLAKWRIFSTKIQ